MKPEKICCTLKGKDNYAVWAYTLKTHLTSSGLGEFIIAKPLVDDPSQDQTVTKTESKVPTTESGNKAQEAKSIILSTLCEKEISNIIHCETALDIWEHFKNAYGKRTSNMKLELFSELSGLVCESASEAPNTLNKALAIRGQLNVLGITVDDLLIISSVMRTLPKSFSNFLDSWSMIDSTDQTLARFADKLLERSKNIAASEQTALMATEMHNLSIHSRERGHGDYRGRGDYSARNGQLRRMVNDQQPIQSRDQSPHQSRDKANDTCNYCHYKGHWKNECRKLARNRGNDRFQHRGISPRRIAFMAIERYRDDGSISRWIVDSGCTSHMTRHAEILHDYDKLDRPVEISLGNGSIIHAIGRGTIKLDKETMSSVLHVPDLGANLFSMSAAMDAGLQANACSSHILFSNKENKIIYEARRTANSFVLDLNICVPEEMALFAATPESWHKRFVHLPLELIKKMAKDEAVEGIQFAETDTDICIECSMNKCRRTSHNSRSTPKAQLPAESLHFDIIGKVEPMSLGSSHYILTCRDEFSSFRMTVCLARKSSVPETVKLIINQSEAQTRCPVRMVTADNGSEFTSERLQIFLQQKGIKARFSAPYVPQQNGTAEAENKNILMQARTILNAAKLPTELWAEAVCTSTYVANRAVKRGREKTPYEVWFGLKPNVSNLRIFGQQACVYIPQNKSKFDPKGRILNFVGYTDNFHTYRFYDPINKTITIACDALFLNEIGPKQMANGYSGGTIAITQVDDHGQQSESFMTLRVNDQDIREPDKQTTINNDKQHTSPDKLNDPSSLQNITEPSAPQEEVTSQAIDDDRQNTAFIGSPTTFPETTTTPEAGMTTTPDTASTSAPATTVTSNVTAPKLLTSTPKRISWADQRNPPMCQTRNKTKIDYKAMATGKHNALMAIENRLPRTFVEAIESTERESWLKACEDEIESMVKNEVFIEVPRPTDRSTIGTRWVFSKKSKPDGGCIHKARFVAKGYNQLFGIDYTESYAPVAYMDQIRLVFSAAAAIGLKMQQFDVRTAFLYSKLKEEVFVEQPDGFSSDKSTVWRLQKSLYGLVQSAKNWNDCITEFLQGCGLTKSTTDDCIFFAHRPTTFVVIYVDDGMIFSKDAEKIEDLIKKIRSKFDIRIVESNRFVGFQYTCYTNGIFLHQEEYIRKIVSRFNMTESNPSDTPMDKCQLTTNNDLLDENYPYREVVGSIQYAAVITRPDVAFTAGYLARKISRPTKNDWQIAMKCLKYLNSTRNLGLLYKATTSNNISIFSDSDYAGDPVTYRSTTGYVILSNDSPVSWKSKLQRTTATSTTEAEFLAISSAMKAATPIKELAKELNILNENETPLYCDNSGAVAITKSQASAQRTRPLGAQLHYAREQHQKKKFLVSHIPAKDQMADIMTKPLIKEKFIKNRLLLMTTMALLSLTTSTNASIFTGTFLETIFDHQTISNVSTDASTYIYQPEAPIIWTKYKTKVQNGTVIHTYNIPLIDPCSIIRRASGTLHIQIVSIILQAVEDGCREVCAESDKLFTRLPFQHKIRNRRNIGSLIAGVARAAANAAIQTGPRITAATALQTARITAASIARTGGNLAVQGTKHTWRWAGGSPGITLTGITVAYQYLAKDSLYNMVLDDHKQLQLINQTVIDIAEKMQTLLYLNDITEDREAIEAKKLRELTTALQNTTQEIPIFNHILNLATAECYHREQQLSQLADAANSNQVDITALSRLANRSEIREIQKEGTELLRLSSNHNSSITIKFTTPSIDHTSQIFEAHSHDIWEEQDGRHILKSYVGPKYALYNQTSNCTKLIRRIDINYVIDSCTKLNTSISILKYGNFQTKESSDMDKEASIILLEGSNYIYCPYNNITINTTTIQCPNYPFLLNTTIPFNIDGTRYEVKSINLTTEGRAYRGTFDHPTSTIIDPELDYLDRTLNTFSRINAMMRDSTDLFPTLPMYRSYKTLALIIALFLCCLWVHKATRTSLVDVLLATSIASMTRPISPADTIRHDSTNSKYTGPIYPIFDLPTNHENEIRRPPTPWASRNNVDADWSNIDKEILPRPFRRTSSYGDFLLREDVKI